MFNSFVTAFLSRNADALIVGIILIGVSKFADSLRISKKITPVLIL